LTATKRQATAKFVCLKQYRESFLETTQVVANISMEEMSLDEKETVHLRALMMPDFWECDQVDEQETDDGYESDEDSLVF
jgi:hypothetical protein